MTAGGIISTLAGGAIGDGGPALFAGLNQPGGVVGDAAGNIYIADTYNHRVRKISPNGLVSTVAGDGSSGYSGDGGPAASARLNMPRGVAIDSAGSLYIADSFNYRVRKITAGGVISTVAGNGICCYWGEGGPATSARLSAYGIAVDGSGNLYIADASSSRIRKVTAGGTISTIAGNGSSGYSGDGGPATAAQLNYPQGLAVDGSGNLFIADTSGNRIRKVSANGTISTFAGTGTYGSSGDDGPAGNAQLASPMGVAVDGSGNLYIAESGTGRVREVIASGTIVALAGNNSYSYYGDGDLGRNTIPRAPNALCVDNTGRLYVSDSSNGAIRLLTPSGTRVRAHDCFYS